MNKKTLKAITNALTVCGDLSNVHGVSGEDSEVFVRGRDVDAYLLISVLAMRIEAGDIELEIKEVGDFCQKKEFFDKLCGSCLMLNREDHP